MMIFLQFIKWPTSADNMMTKGNPVYEIPFFGEAADESGISDHLSGDPGWQDAV